MMGGFLPVSREEMVKLGWKQPDFVYVIGDAYVDHPSFGHAIISRVLENAGYKVAICSQPDWKNPAIWTLWSLTTPSASIAAKPMPIRPAA